jgi:cytochrome c
VNISPEHKRAAFRLDVAYMIAFAMMGSMQNSFAQTIDQLAADKAVYEAKCGGCHSVDANRVGPMHRGVVGRRVGSVAGYSYSPALRHLGGVWTTDLLDKWLQNPQALAPGSNMSFSVTDAEQRHQIIDYLQSVSVPQRSRIDGAGLK